MKINLMCPINSLGYGYTGLNIVKSLNKLNVEVALFPIGGIQATSKEDETILRECLERARFFDAQAPCIKIWHQNDMAQFVGKGIHIGFPIFELDQFSRIERHHLKSVDRLMVCSAWAKEVIKENLGELCASQTDVIPLGVDTSLFKPVLSNPAQKDTIFFNCGKWEIRKGHDILIDLFTKAFSKDDNVQLWVMSENPFCTEEEKSNWESLYIDTEHYENGKIKLIPRVQSHQQVYNIMKEADCGVFPSRAEGWNLEALEMLACGKKLIITNYSAHTEFCTPENSYLINTKNKELAFDNKWFFGQGNWASLDIENYEYIIESMRLVHATKKAGYLKLNEEGIETANNFTWENSARKILNVIKTF